MLLSYPIPCIGSQTPGSMTKLTIISIYRQLPIHMGTMRIALLLLMVSTCLIDFGSARGVAMVGKHPGYFLTEPTYGPSEEKWYWTKRYILFIGTGSTDTSH